MERTVVLIKPDGYQRKLAGEVISRLERLDLQLSAAKMIHLSDAILRDHYAHLVEKPFFGELKEFMQSAPVIALIWEGPECVSRVRDCVGLTDPAKAPKGTIRGDFGTDKMRNIVHAADSPEAAEHEIKRFFRPEEIF